MDQDFTHLVASTSVIMNARLLGSSKISIFFTLLITYCLAANSSAVARVSSILSSCSSSSTGRRNDLSKPLSRAPPPSSSSVRTPDDSPTLLRQLRHAKEMGYSDAAIMAALEANAEKSDDRSNLEKKRVS